MEGHTYVCTSDRIERESLLASSRVAKGDSYRKTIESNRCACCRGTAARVCVAALRLRGLKVQTNMGYVRVSSFPKFPKVGQAV